MHTKRMIIDAMKRLLEKRNFENITVIDVVKEAGIGRATFYKHFENKYELATTLFSEYVTLEFFMMEYNGDNLNERIESLLVFLKNNREYFKKIFKIDGSESFYIFLEKYFYESYQQHGKIRFGIEKFTDEQIFKMKFAANQWAYCLKFWVNSKCEPDEKKYAQWLTSSILKIEDIV